jgi:hypothetical protein
VRLRSPWSAWTWFQAAQVPADPSEAVLEAHASPRRVCEDCGEEFAPRRGGQAQLFCAAKCRQRAHAKRQAANGRAATGAPAQHAARAPGPDQAARPGRCALPDALPDDPRDRPFGVRLEDALPSDALAPPALPWDEHARA